MAEYRRTEFYTILSIVIILSLIGNILVVVISGFCVKLRSMTNIFILNLALSDLLFTAGLVFRVYDHFWGSNLGDAACKAVYFVFSFGFYSSIAFLLLLSIHQYNTRVINNSGWMKGWILHCVVLFCSWVVSIWAALIATAYSTVFNYSSKPESIVITYRENIIFVYVILFMGICYFRILRTIFKSPPNKKNRTTLLAFLLVATYFICWAPYNIVNFMDTLTYYPIKFSTRFLENLNYASNICRLLAYTRCCLNPLIYALFGVKFHKETREIFQRRVTPNSEQIGMEEHHSHSSASV